MWASRRRHRETETAAEEGAKNGEVQSDCSIDAYRRALSVVGRGSSTETSSWKNPSVCGRGVAGKDAKAAAASHVLPSCWRRTGESRDGSRPPPSPQRSPTGSREGTSGWMFDERLHPSDPPAGRDVEHLELPAGKPAGQGTVDPDTSRRGRSIASARQQNERDGDGEIVLPAAGPLDSVSDVCREGAPPLAESSTSSGGESATAYLRIPARTSGFFSDSPEPRWLSLRTPLDLLLGWNGTRDPSEIRENERGPGSFPATKMRKCCERIIRSKFGIA